MGRRKNQELYYIAGGGKVAPIGTRPGQQAGMVPRSQPTAAVVASKPSAAIAKPLMQHQQPNSKLDEQIIEMRLQQETLQKERDFYFGKLRDIEVLLQARGGEATENETAADVLKILYASEEEKVQVNNDGTLIVSNANAAPVTATE